MNRTIAGWIGLAAGLAALCGVAIAQQPPSRGTAQAPNGLSPQAPNGLSPKAPNGLPPQAAKPGSVQTAGANEVAALILAGEESTLSSQMAGRIRQISVGLGDEFKKGTRLIEFDCSEQQAQLDTAEAEYRAARETHLARLRLQALGAAGELEVTVAAAAADKARSQVSYRESQLAYCRVEAPFAGNVARMRVKASESVPAGQPLIDLVNTSTLKAQMFVPSSWVAWLRAGTPVTIHIRETGQAFRARVSKMNSRIDGVSQQLEVEARIEKGGGKLLPGMVGAAVFDQPKKP